MKAATGELNLTVITLIAVAAVIAFFWVMWDPITNSIKDQWGDAAGNTRSNSSSLVPGES